MSIAYNSTTIQNLYCNNTEMTKAYSNTIKVFEKITDPLWYCFAGRADGGTQSQYDIIMYISKLTTEKDNIIKQYTQEEKHGSRTYIWCNYANTSLDLNYISYPSSNAAYFLYDTYNKSASGSTFLHIYSINENNVSLKYMTSYINGNRSTSHDLYT